MTVKIYNKGLTVFLSHLLPLIMKITTTLEKKKKIVENILPKSPLMNDPHAMIKKGIIKTFVVIQNFAIQSS